MKPFLYYYLIVVVVLMVINALGFSSLFQREVREVPYNELIRQVDEGLSLIHICVNMSIRRPRKSFPRRIRFGKRTLNRRRN